MLFANPRSQAYTIRTLMHLHSFTIVSPPILVVTKLDIISILCSFNLEKRFVYLLECRHRTSQFLSMMMPYKVARA
jgi:hypothetical protein